MEAGSLPTGSAISKTLYHCLAAVAQSGLSLLVNGHHACRRVDAGSSPARRSPLMTRQWKRVKDGKEPTKENVPDKIIEKALSWATVFKKCAECGTEQFLHFRPGHNATGKCKECGAEGVI